LSFGQPFLPSSDEMSPVSFTTDVRPGATVDDNIQTVSEMPASYAFFRATKPPQARRTRRGCRTTLAELIARARDQHALDEGVRRRARASSGL